MNERENTRAILAESLNIIRNSVFPGKEAARVSMASSLLEEMVKALDIELANTPKEDNNAPQEEIVDRDGVEL